MGAGASEMPQFPATTVVTPWLTFGAISGEESIRRSSCVCASMKPGAAIFPAASISFLPFSLTFPMRAIFPALTAISASKRGARVPSITVALRITRSSLSVNFRSLVDLRAERRITSAHFGVSRFTSAMNSSGVPPSGSVSSCL